ncbi:MAG: hypothetical protein O3C40_19960 [Planctomycetota bacterium]|nr:hypothetical protein [Planctomycetota bacterium]
MLRKLYCIGLLSLVSLSLGCAMCCSPDDYNYGAYGGRWQRQEMSSGRVSSAFAEAGYDSRGNMLDVGPAAEPGPLPGDNHLRPVSYDEVSSYIE